MSKEKAQSKPAQITVVSKKDGFRRGGYRFSETPVTIDTEELEDAQYEQIMHEHGKNLIVTSGSTVPEKASGDDEEVKKALKAAADAQAAAEAELEKVKKELAQTVEGAEETVSKIKAERDALKEKLEKALKKASKK